MCIEAGSFCFAGLDKFSPTALYDYIGDELNNRARVLSCLSGLGSTVYTPIL